MRSSNLNIQRMLTSSNRTESNLYLEKLTPAEYDEYLQLRGEHYAFELRRNVGAVNVGNLEAEADREAGANVETPQILPIAQLATDAAAALAKTQALLAAVDLGGLEPRAYTDDLKNTPASPPAPASPEGDVLAAEVYQIVVSAPSPIPTSSATATATVGTATSAATPPPLSLDTMFNPRVTPSPGTQALQDDLNRVLGSRSPATQELEDDLNNRVLASRRLF
jgi:hypothetical protein